MSTNCQRESVGCTFQWKIQNINHCWLQKGERLDSPPFTADALEGTKWILRLYPEGHRDKNNVGFFLHRDVDCSGPDDIEVSFEFSFLGKDGSFLKAKKISAHSFPRNRSWGLGICEARVNAVFIEKETFPPEDVITVKCTIWDSKEKPLKLKKLYARTVFKDEHKFFKWEIGKLNDFKLNAAKKFNDNLIEFDLILEENKDFEKALIMNINLLNKNIKYFTVKSSYEDSEGNQKNCRFWKCFKDNLRIGKLCTLHLNNWLKRNQSQNYSIRSFSFDCEYVVQMKTAFYESSDFSLYSPEVLSGEVSTIHQDSIENEKSVTREVLNDLKYMYDEAILSDVELRTWTKAFPAHKAILSARSPVFRCMFSNSMKEKKNGKVEVIDFEEDTVHRMLLYMYTDSIEGLQFENASKLYTIADKYQILSLKNRCSTLLKGELSLRNACEILFLADQHQDDSLKSFVQDYILKHDKEIFGLQAWKNLMKDNPKLAADLMYRKMYPD